MTDTTESTAADKDAQVYNDGPIESVEADLYGFDPFAKALAQCFLRMRNPIGAVVALNGPWGSGKSSTVNLMRRHLEAADESKDIKVISFSSWWFRGEEALALAFFRELYAGMGPNRTQEAKRLFKKLGSQLLKAGETIGAVVDAIGGAGAGSTVGGIAKSIGDAIEMDEGVEATHARLSDQLKKAGGRYLVIIDDIDRLSPDEALLIFRLVKSAGRLPGVMYLLVFDRELADKIVSKAFPEEGDHYLEKIVQTSFELPPPDHSDLVQQVFSLIQQTAPPENDAAAYDFVDKFWDVVAPELRTPRDVSRLTNAWTSTWPVVEGEVDVGDFLSMEVIRLNQPGLYRTIRENKALICGDSQGYENDRQGRVAELNRLFLEPLPEQDRGRYRTVLIRLFPRLSGGWTNYYQHDNGTWAERRRVCSLEHFHAYFRLAPGPNALPRPEIEELASRAGDSEFVEGKLRAALSRRRKNGMTHASLLLDELTLRAGLVKNEDVLPLLKTLARIADDLDGSEDEIKGMPFLDNHWRITRCFRQLTLERFAIEERSKLVLTACAEASTGFLVELSDTAYRYYHPAENRAPLPPEQCLTTEEDLAPLRQLALEAIRRSSQDGTLLAQRKLSPILHRWRWYADDNGVEVRAWTSTQLQDDAAVLSFARAFTGEAQITGMGPAGIGNRVARRSVRARVGYVDEIVDASLFRTRATAVLPNLSGKDAEDMGAFLEAWERHDKNPD